MPAVIKKSFFLEWDHLFSKNISKPFIASFIFVPIITFIFVEVHSLKHFEASAHEVESEVAQAILTSDSYLATRMLKVIERALQLSFAEIRTANGPFASTGKLPNYSVAPFLWYVSIPIKSQWGAEIGTLVFVGKPMPIQRVLAFLFVAFSIFIFLVLNYFLKQLRDITKDQIAEIDGIAFLLSSDSPKRIDANFFRTEFKNETAAKLAEALGHFITLKDQAFEQNLKIEKDASFSTLAKQVAHDIRSPLSALNIVSSALRDISEDKRLLMRNAIQRINDIANDLLTKGKQFAAQVQTSQYNQDSQNLGDDAKIVELILLTPLVDSIISEKRIQFRDQINVRIDSDFKNSFGVFVKANGQDLMRVLSNLINNAVEAFIDTKGEVIIAVKDLDRAVLLKVSDNGKGIPPEVLKKLGLENISYGKTGSASGSGIGVYHAKKIIESLGGKFNVLSNLGQGTQVEIILPKADAPAWFLNAMILPFGTKIYCLDDDLTIHQIWQGRLTSLPADKNKIEFMSFTSAQEFKIYHHKVIKAQPAQSQIFLIDFELLNQGTNGLEVIEELKIHQIYQNVVLVTSRYDEPEIRNKCERFNIKLLPKSLAGSVPIELVLPKEKYDWILIDDDELIHMSWQLAAHEYNKKFLGFKTSQEFMKIQKNIELDSAIYIDSNLGCDVRGELVAKQLFDLGFHELYLATGSSPDSFEPMYFVKDIVGKMPPAG